MPKSEKSRNLHAFQLILISATCCRTQTHLLSLFEVGFPVKIMSVWWWLHAAASFHITSVGFSVVVDSCRHLNSVLDVTLLCFRDLLVPAVREVGKLWVFYFLTYCQMFPGCMGTGAVTVAFKSNVVIEVKRLVCWVFGCLLCPSCLFLWSCRFVSVSCSLPCWPTGNGWATRHEGEEW